MRVEYRHFPPVTVFYARSMGPYASSSREAWQQVADWLDRNRARKRIKQAFGIHRDDPRCTAPELLRYDACVPVMCCADLELAPGISRQTLSGGAYAVHTHVGSYEEAGELLSHLHSEIVPKRALSVDYDRAFLAVYLNDPRVTREVHRRTELCIPVLPLPMAAASNDAGEPVERNAAVARGLALAG